MGWIGAFGTKDFELKSEVIVPRMAKKDFSAMVINTQLIKTLNVKAYFIKLKSTQNLATKTCDLLTIK